MSCGWEQRVALYAGGDLDAAEASTVERHVAGCRECAALARDLESDREMLRSAPPQLAEVDFAEMCHGVVGRTRRPRLVPAMLAAAAVVAALAIGLTRHNRERPVPPPPPVVVARVAPPVAVVAPTAPLPNGRGSVRYRSGEHKEAQPFPIPGDAFRVPTKDPSVVIIWFAETKGDSNE
jgi:anti-sigma factor RsiW